MESKRRVLYPHIEPYAQGHLEVSDLHELYYEECGNPAGKPVVFLHGGPGGGGDTRPRRFFDPARYRIVLFDQRGCGRSRPNASLEENTTWHLIEDIEQLRRHLGIDRWQVFGGSWGSTLSLLYAQTHPERVTELIVRGIFLLREKEFDWFYQRGASEIFPDLYSEYVAPIPPEERHDLMNAFHRRLIGDNEEAALAAARAWSVWEGAISTLLRDDAYVEKFGEGSFALAIARIECHYFVNGGFLERPNQILEDVTKIRHIPGVIVQGRYDIVCPVASAWDLHLAWPEAEFRIVPDAGHIAFEPGILHELIEATDKFAS